MTTIAYRAGIIAADSGATVGATVGGSQAAFMNKVVKNAQGAVAGVCGRATWCQQFLDWFMECSDDPSPVNPHEDLSAAITVSSKRKIRMIESNKGTSGHFDIAAPYYAIGSGRCEALGAMYHGASAADAVRAAVALDESTFGRVRLLRVGK